MNNKTMSMSMYIYNDLKEKIITLELKPGEQIGEEIVANMYNSSRTPAKTALIRLEANGFINIIPQVGSFISKIDSEKIIEFLSVRSILEMHIMDKVLNSVTASDIIFLKYNLSEQEKVVESQEDYLEKSIKFFNLDNEFHERLFAIANQELLWKHVKSISHHIDRYRILLNILPDGDNLKSTYKDHIELLEKIENKDSDLEKLYHQHMFGHFNSMFSVLVEQYPDYFK